MIVFLSLILLLIIQGRTIHNRTTFLTIAFIELTLISGFRLPVLNIGADTEWYYYNYLNFKDVKIDHFDHYYHEMGFDFLCYILCKINNHPQFLLFATQVIMNGGIIWLIKKCSKIPWLSVVLYITFQFYFWSMNAMRFCLACTFLLLSIDSIVNRKLIKFVSIVLFASLFHFTALFFAIIYFIYPLKLTTKNLIYIAVPFALTMVFVLTLFDFLISINDKYTSYGAGGEFYASSFANVLIFLVALLVLLFIIKKNPQTIVELNGYNKVFVLCVFLGVLFAAMSIKIMMAVRFHTMYSIFEIILIPNIIFCLKSRISRKKWTIFWLLLTICQMIVIFTYRPEWYAITPYRNFLIN